MKKYKSCYLKPYIRRGRKEDLDGRKACNILIAGEMKKYENIKKFYVVCVRGKKTILMFGKSKDNIKKETIGNKKNNHIMKKFNKLLNEKKHYFRS